MAKVQRYSSGSREGKEERQLREPETRETREEDLKKDSRLNCGQACFELVTTKILRPSWTAYCQERAAEGDRELVCVCLELEANGDEDERR